MLSLNTAYVLAAAFTSVIYTVYFFN